MSNATLALCILIQQRERNEAIGVKRDTQLLRGLSAYVRRTTKIQAQADISLLAKAAWLKATIEEYTDLSKRLTEHITENIEDADTRNEGVYVMTKLEAYITQLADQLEELKLWA